MSIIVKMMSEQNLPDDNRAKGFSLVEVKAGSQITFERNLNNEPQMVIHMDNDPLGLKTVYPLTGNVYIRYPDGSEEQYVAESYFNKKSIINAYRQFLKIDHHNAEELYKDRLTDENSIYPIIVIYADILANIDKLNKNNSLLVKIKKPLFFKTYVNHEVYDKAIKRFHELGFHLMVEGNHEDVQDYEDLTIMVTKYGEIPEIIRILSPKQNELDLTVEELINQIKGNLYQELAKAEQYVFDNNLSVFYWIRISIIREIIANKNSAVTIYLPETDEDFDIERAIKEIRERFLKQALIDVGKTNDGGFRISKVYGETEELGSHVVMEYIHSLTSETMKFDFFDTHYELIRNELIRILDDEDADLSIVDYVYYATLRFIVENYQYPKFGNPMKMIIPKTIINLDFDELNEKLHKHGLIVVSEYDYASLEIHRI